MAKQLLTYNLSEPLQGISKASYDFNVGTGNLTIEPLESGSDLLANGSLEYLEKQAAPSKTVQMDDGRAVFALKAAGGLKPGFHFPWQACMGETTWQMRLNPAVSSEISAHSGGGIVKLDLSGMNVTKVTAESGGGSMSVILPEGAAALDATARSGGGNVSVELGQRTAGSNVVTATSGAGNVTVTLPAGIAALIHATTGMGKLIIDPSFIQLDKATYRSADYDSAADRVEVTAKSGAGNVSVIVK